MKLSPDGQASGPSARRLSPTGPAGRVPQPGACRMSTAELTEPRSPASGGCFPPARLVEPRGPLPHDESHRAGGRTHRPRARGLSPDGPAGRGPRPGASAERRPIARHVLPRSAAPERPGANHLRRSPTTDQGRRSVCPSVTAGARACWSTRAGGHTALVVLQVQTRAQRPGTDMPARPARSRKHRRPAGSPARATWPNRVRRGSGRNERYTNGRQVAPDNRRQRQRDEAGSCLLYTSDAADE